MTPQQRFVAHVLETRRAFRADCAGCRAVPVAFEVASAIGRAAHGRLLTAYLPVLQTLQRVERDIARITALAGPARSFAPKRRQ